MHFPKYALPPEWIVSLGRDILLLRKRDFQRDAIACITKLHPPLNVIGFKNIPQRGPCDHGQSLSPSRIRRALARLEGPTLDWLNAAQPGAWIGYKGLFVFGAIMILLSALILKKINEKLPKTSFPADRRGNRRVIIGIESSTFTVVVLNWEQVISLLLLLVREPRSASAVLAIHGGSVCALY